MASASLVHSICGLYDLHDPHESESPDRPGGYSNPGFPAQYLTTPTERFTVPPHSYFALGDNSYNSSDSRYWGIVPEKNVIGRGFVVYWPFSSRWGFIR